MRWWRAVLLAGTLGAASPALAQVQAQQVVLNQWAERHFESIGKSCIGSFKAKKKETVVPANVRTWPVLEPHWGQTVNYAPMSTVNGVFATVYRREGTSLVTAGAPLGIDWSRSVEPLLYAQRGQARQEHNCTSLLSAKASTKLDLSFADLQTALSSAYDVDTSLTSYMYAGSIISPLTTTLDRNATVTERPSGLPPFSAWLAIWNWYRLNPGQIAAGDAAQLEIFDTLEGAAYQTVRGLTQKALLEGSASVSAGIPFFSVSSDVNGQGNRRLRENVTDYSVVYWDSATTRLPRPADVVASAPKWASFSPAADNPSGVEDTPTPQRYAVELSDVPPILCSPALWNLKPTPGAVALSDLDIAPVPANGTRCRISAVIAPAKPPTSSVTIAFTLGFPIDSSAAGNRELVIRSRPISLPDYRAAVSLGPVAGNRNIALLPGQTTPAALKVSFPIREREATRRTAGVVPGSFQGTIACPANPETSILPTAGGIAWSRRDDGATLDVTLQIDPAIAAQVAPGTPVTCRIAGGMMLTMNGTLPPVRVDLPGFEVSIVRAADSPAPPTPVPPVAPAQG